MRVPLPRGLRAPRLGPYVITAALLVLAACDSAGPAPDRPGPTPAPLAGERVVFADERDGDSEIYTKSADGTGLVQPTGDDARDGTPKGSPDGTHVAFESPPDRRFDVLAVALDVSGETNLTDHPGHVYQADWVDLP